VRRAGRAASRAACARATAACQVVGASPRPIAQPTPAHASRSARATITTAQPGINLVPLTGQRRELAGKPVGRRACRRGGTRRAGLSASLPGSRGPGRPCDRPPGPGAPRACGPRPSPRRCYVQAHNRPRQPPRQPTPIQRPTRQRIASCLACRRRSGKCGEHPASPDRRDQTRPSGLADAHRERPSQVPEPARRYAARLTVCSPAVGALPTARSGQAGGR